MSEERTVRMSPEKIKRRIAAGEDRTDWERLMSLTDEEIEAAVREDPDAVLLDKDWFEEAEWVVPEDEKETVALRLDSDVLDFFREKGKNEQRRINTVLRAYVLAQRMEEREDARSK